MSKTARQRSYHVADPKGLALLVRETVDARYGGRVNRAAKALAGVRKGVTFAALAHKQKKGVWRIQKSLDRIVKGASSRIEQPAYELLVRLVPAARHQELDRLLLSGPAMAAHETYGRWLARTQVNHIPPKPPRWIVLNRHAPAARDASRGTRYPTDHVPTDTPGRRASLERAAFRQARLKVLEGSVPLEGLEQLEDVADALRGRFPYECAQFDDFVARRRHSRERSELAWCRIISPLLDHIPSGFVERDWGEMSDKELRQFLQAGIKRETILLQRATDIERAQEAVLLTHRFGRPTR